LKVGSKASLTADVPVPGPDPPAKAPPTVTLNADVSRLDLGDLPSAPAEPAAGQRPVAGAARALCLPCRFPRPGSRSTSLGDGAAGLQSFGLGKQGDRILDHDHFERETRFAFRAAATVGSGSAGFDLD